MIPNQLNDSQKNALLQHQKRVSSIYKQRTKICQQLSQVSKQRRMSSLACQQKSKQDKNQNDNLDQTRKLVKKDSQTVKFQSQSLSSKNNIKLEQSFQDKNKSKQLEKQSSLNQNQIDRNNKEKKLDKSTESNPTVVDRNRRIFGGINSYLKKAGAHLQSKQEKDKLDSAKQILNKVIQKEKQQRISQQMIKMQQLDARIQKLNALKKQSEQKLNKAQNELLCFIVKSHYNAIGNFYLTKTQPKICWKPKKNIQDAEKQQKIKSQGEKYIKEIKDKSKDKILEYNQYFSYNRQDMLKNHRFLQYMTQNQKQFYQNFIKNMYINHKNNIRTKTEPFIFWRPNLFNQKLLKLKAQTNESLQQDLNNFRQKNVQWYNNYEKIHGIRENHDHIQFEHDIQDNQEKQEEEEEFDLYQTKK